MTNSFGATSTADEVLRGINLSGKQVLVTGVSAGLGVETARVDGARRGSERKVGRRALWRELNAQAQYRGQRPQDAECLLEGTLLI